MKIDIDKYTIISIPDGFMIYELTTIQKGPNKGGTFQNNKRWYGKLDMALNRLLLQVSTDSDIKSIEALISTIKTTEAKIIATVKSLSTASDNE